MTGSTDDIVLEGISDATLAYTEGHLCLVVGNGIATFCDDANIAESSMQATNEGILMPVVSITPTPFNYNEHTVTPTLTATFTNLEGSETAAEIRKIFYQEDYENTTSTTAWTSPGANMSIATGDATYGNYFYVNTGASTNTRWAYQRLSGVDVSTASAYAIEFDLAIKAGNTDPVEFCVMSKGGTNPTNNWDSYAAINNNANMLFDITAPKGSSIYTLNGTSTTTTLAADTWYHYTLHVDRIAKTVDWNISNGSSGTFNLPQGTSADFDGFYLVAGRYNSIFRFDNIYIYPTDYYEYAFTEPGTLTVTSSYEGCAPKRTSYDVEFVGTQIGTGGWTTLGCRYPLVLSSDALTEAGLEAAYIVSEQNTNSVTLSAVQSVPAYTGLLMKGASSTYRLPIATSPADVNTNLLVAVTNVEGFTVNSDDVYVLAEKSAGLGFYPCAQGVTVPAGKAYLTLPGPVRSFIRFTDGDTTTGISQDATCTTHDAQAVVVYDLQGRKIENRTFANGKLPKGIYISGNRKVIVK
jgi:hypothetical protein